MHFEIEICLYKLRTVLNFYAHTIRSSLFYKYFIIYYIHGNMSCDLRSYFQIIFVVKGFS